MRRPFLLVTTAGALLLPASARASDPQLLVGLSVSLTAVDEGSPVGIGIDARFVGPLPGEGLVPLYGAFTRAELRGMVPRLSLGPLVGVGIAAVAPQCSSYTTWHPAGAGLLESGVAVDPSQTGVHLGVMAESGSVLTATLRGDTTLLFEPDRTSFASGHTVALGGALGVFNAQADTCSWVDGRPLRDGAHRRRPSVWARRAEAPSARRWLDRGRDELEAVDAFLHLANEIDALGAPAVLGARSRAAAREELGHAVACFRIAARQTGGPVLARRLAPLGRSFSSRGEALRQLGHESLSDGWDNEGRAARRLRKEALLEPERAARALRRIAAEEEGHAGLGREIAAWCRRAR